MIDQTYLDEIRKKLDAMNRQAGVDPSKKGDPTKSKYEPDLIDPFQAQGLAAIKYMEQQKKKAQDI